MKIHLILRMKVPTDNGGQKNVDHVASEVTNVDKRRMKNIIVQMQKVYPKQLSMDVEYLFRVQGKQKYITLNEVMKLLPDRRKK